MAKLNVQERVDRARLDKVTCTACRIPKATGACTHIITTDDYVIMGKAAWADLVDELNELRGLEENLRGDGLI